MVRDFGQINLTDSRLPPPSKAIRHEFDVAVAQPEIAPQMTKFIAGALLDRGFVFGTLVFGYLLNWSLTQAIDQGSSWPSTMDHS
jgi:hypothetical protein